MFAMCRVVAPLSTATTDPDLLPRFGDYQAVQRLASGGMAEIYRALKADGELMVEFVLKRLKPMMARDPAIRAMFLVEGRVQMLFRHPSLVRAWDCGENGEGQFIVMECVEGIDVLSLLRARRRGLSAAAVLLIAKAVAGGLAYAHTLSDENGTPLRIVHRDVSPANIMITDGGVVRLIDFGVARIADSPALTRTLPGQLKGKLGYMSPEQLDGLPHDDRVDQFALGVVMYECLLGKPLYRTKEDFESLRKARRRALPAPSACVSLVPPSLDKVMLKLLEPDPRDRFRTCTEVHAALEEVLADRPPPNDYLAKLIKRPRLGAVI
jgi:eukaryotic-like serine/threonine-protein kinase